MRLEERQERILSLLLEQDLVSVSELSSLFDVSLVTVRNDLNQLAEQGRIVRVHGGARLSGERTRQETSFAARQRLNAEQKRCIGLLAAQFVQPDETILLDASTTAVAVAQALRLRNDLTNITLVTTGIWTALEMLGTPGIEVVLTGGTVRTITGSITGLITNEVLGRFNFRRGFLGAWGLTPEAGLTDQSLVEVELKQTILPRCQEVNGIVDGSKFGRVATASFAALPQIARILTDSSAPAEMVQTIRDEGVEVLVACDEQPSPSHHPEVSDDRTA